MEKNISKDEPCWYCKATPYGDTRNIGIQTFRDGSVSNIKLNPYNTQLLTGETWNIPDKGANQYRVVAKINYCPICGRSLIN